MLNTLLASDESNREFINPKNPDDALAVTFYQRPVAHNFNIQTNVEHAACGDEPNCPHAAYLKGKTFPLPESVIEEWVNISIPGRQDTSIHEQVRADHKARFPRQWAAFNNNLTNAEQQFGTKLAEWGVLSEHQITAIQAQRFYTVEQIAQCSDGQIQALGMNGHVLRQQARAFVLKARESTESARAKAEADSKAKELQELKDSIPAMIAAAVREAMSQTSPQQLPAAAPKRGRPRKVKDGTDAAATSQPGAG